MNYKGKLFIIGLILLVLLSVSMVSAEENNATISSRMTLNETSDVIYSYSESNIDLIDIEKVDDDFTSDSNKTAILESDSEQIINAKIIVLNSVNEYQNGNFSFKLVDKDNEANILEGKTIYLRSIGNLSLGFSAKTNNEGIATFSTKDLYVVSDDYFKQLEVGNHLFEISATDNINAEKVITNLTIIKANVNIEISDVGEYYGKNKSVVIRVTNKNDGSAVPDIILRLYMPQTSGKIYYFKTNPEGISNIYLDSLAVGNYGITVTNNDTKNINKVSSTKNLVIRKTIVQVNISCANLKYKDSKFIIRITDEKGEAMSNVVTLVTFDNKIKYLFASSDEGYVSFITHISSGSHILTVDVVDTNYTTSSISKNIFISKGSVSITAIKNSGIVGKYITLKALVNDKYGKVDEGTVKFTIDGKSYSAKVVNGVATKKIKLPKEKKYVYSAKFLSNNYNSKTAKSSIITKKEKIKISAISSSNIKNEQSILKAIVKNVKGNLINEGTVKFTIDGKNYNAKVHNGVAQKKIKLSEIKTYNYKAKFISNSYVPKTSTSKVIVKKIPTFTIKIGKYGVKISYNDYKKIKKAETSGRFIKKYDTGKTINYKIYADKKITKTKKKLYSYGTYTTYYIPNPDALKAPSGYKYAGKQFTVENGIEKVYMIYKKTTYKKVLVKTPKTKVYISIEATPWHGAIAKLYHLKTVYDGSYTYYLGNQKSIF